MQERHLSKRKLIFKRLGMTWQCDCKKKQIESPHHLRFLPPTPLGGMVHPTERYLNHWRDLVTEFSGRQLSFPGDRLLAIQGIANELQERVSQRPGKRGLGPYVTGHWTRAILPQLLWSVNHKDHQNQLEPTRNPDNQFPTWSWASVQLLGKFIPWPEIRDSYLKADRARIEGRHFPVVQAIEIRNDTSGDINMNTSHKYNSITITGLCEPVLSFDESIFRNMIDCDQIILDEWIEKERMFEELQTKWLFQNWSNPADWSDSASADWSNSGLVLSEVSSGVFRRVGMYYQIDELEAANEKRTYVNYI
jgi:hypothetical protein